MWTFFLYRSLLFVGTLWEEKIQRQAHSFQIVYINLICRNIIYQGFFLRNIKNCKFFSCNDFIEIIYNNIIICNNNALYGDWLWKSNFNNEKDGNALNFVKIFQKSRFLGWTQECLYKCQMDRQTDFVWFRKRFCTVKNGSILSPFMVLHTFAQC